MRIHLYLTIASLLLALGFAGSNLAVAHTGKKVQQTFQVKNGSDGTVYTRKHRRSGDFLPIKQGGKLSIRSNHLPIYFFQKESGSQYFRGTSSRNQACPNGTTYIYYHSSIKEYGHYVKVGVYGESCTSMENAIQNSLAWRAEYERRLLPPKKGEIRQNLWPELKD